MYPSVAILCRELSIQPAESGIRTGRLVPTKVLHEGSPQCPLSGPVIHFNEIFPTCRAPHCVHLVLLYKINNSAFIGIFPNRASFRTRGKLAALPPDVWVSRALRRQRVQ